jgi:hypothetical protein
MFCGFRHDLHRSQDNHVEIVVEKNTLFDLLKYKVASQLCIPIQSARGYSSYPASKVIADRFSQSLKKRLIVVYVSDFDPEGIDMLNAFDKYFRIDHGIEPVTVRAAVTKAQIEKYNLIPDAEAKSSSSRYKGFVKQHGLDCYELDSMPMDKLVEEVTDACKSVLNIEALNHEIQEQDYWDVELAKLREAVKDHIWEHAHVMFGGDLS